MIPMFRTLWWAVVLAGATSRALGAELPPVATNAIRGVVRFTNTDPDILARLGPPGNEGISSVVLIANSEPPDTVSASKYVPNADFLSNEYALTVSAGATPIVYQVYASMSLDGILEEYLTATLAAAPLTSNSPPAELNLEECVALIEFRYQRPDGIPVAAVDGRATVNETAAPYFTSR